MTDKTIRRTIVAEIEDKVSGALQKMGGAFREVADKAKAMVVEQAKGNTEAAKAPSLWDRMKASAKGALDSMRQGQQAVTDQTTKMSAGMQHLEGRIKQAFSAAVLAQFVRSMMQISDEMAKVEQAGRKIALHGGGGFSDTSNFGKQFGRQAEAFEQAFGLEGGSVSQDMKGAFAELLKSGVIDVAAADVADQIQRAMLALFAAQTAGADVNEVAKAAGAVTDVSGVARIEQAAGDVGRALGISGDADSVIAEVLVKAGFSEQMGQDFRRTWSDTLGAFTGEIAEVWRDETLGLGDKILGTIAGTLTGLFADRAADTLAQQDAQAAQIRNRVLGDVLPDPRDIKTREDLTAAVDRLSDLLRSGSLDAGQSAAAKDRLVLIQGLELSPKGAR